jgi:hypothetical protein
VSDIRKMLESSVDGYAPDPETGLAATLRLLARRDRRRRVGAAAVALALLATVLAFGFALTFRGRTSPASSPPLPPAVRPATPVVVPGAAPAAGGLSLCAAAAPGADCVPNATFRVGEVVELRGGRRKRSLPEGTRVEIWWRAPERDGWRRLGIVAADEGGQIVWSWRPPKSVKQGTYGFQLRIPSLGASPVVDARLLRTD